MLDLKFIRNNQEVLKEAVKNKNEKADIEEIIRLDEYKRKLQFQFDNLRAHQKSVSKDIPNLKKKGEDISELLKEMGKVSAQIKSLTSEVAQVEEQLNDQIMKVPNIPHESVPIGPNESDNVEIGSWGNKSTKDFKRLDHLELAEKRNLLDFKRATKMAGSGFAGYTGMGALLERALINFMLDFHVFKHGYKELSLPFIVNRGAMTGTGQLPKLADDMYHVELDDLFLVPTAEVSITNFHASEILSNKSLPIKFVSYSPCFRREAGSYGKDTKGLQRLHQFNKVEMVQLVHPDESYNVLETMIEDAADILKILGLHYRKLNLATGDLSFASAKTIDLEVWAPGAEKYYEVSSISNFEDFQARRASLRFRDSDDRVRYLHTLNGSGLATPRTFIALIETYQNPDGSISVPDVLQPYMQGIKII